MKSFKLFVIVCKTAILPSDEVPIAIGTSSENKSPIFRLNKKSLNDFYII